MHRRSEAVARLCGSECPHRPFLLPKAAGAPSARPCRMKNVRFQRLLSVSGWQKSAQLGQQCVWTEISLEAAAMADQRRGRRRTFR